MGLMTRVDGIVKDYPAKAERLMAGRRRSCPSQ